MMPRARRIIDLILVGPFFAAGLLALCLGLVVVAVGGAFAMLIDGYYSSPWRALRAFCWSAIAQTSLEDRV